MDVSWSDWREGWSRNPVCYSRQLTLPVGFGWPTDAELAEIFKTAGFSLQTWKRSKAEDGSTILIDDPHWIGVHGSTPLHVDPKYPRYTHHLKVRVSPGCIARGLDKVELPLVRGTFYILDTHSPHQVLFRTGRKAAQWNISASIDHHEALDPQPTIERLVQFVRTESFV